MNELCDPCRTGDHAEHSTVIDWSVPARRRRPCCCETCTAIPF